MKQPNISFDHLSNATQQKILETAIKVFSQKGFSGSTTKEIALEAGVSEATIFRYFNTKKDLLLALISPAMVKSVTNLFYDIHGKSIDEILLNFFQETSAAIDGNKDLLKILLYESLFYPEVREVMFNEIVTSRNKLLQKYLSEHQSIGEFKDIDPKIAMRVLSGMLIGYMVWKYAYSNKDISQQDDEKIFNDMIEIFLHGYKK